MYHHYTEVLYDLFELHHIRRRHSGSFVGICCGMNLAFKYLIMLARQHQQRNQLAEEDLWVVHVVDNVGTEGFIRQPMLDGREGVEYHRWFILGQLNTPVLELGLFDEELLRRGPTCTKTDDAAAVAASGCG